MGPQERSGVDGRRAANYTGQIIETEAQLACEKNAAKRTHLTCSLARLYWLRGIYWENGDPKSLGKQQNIALADFQRATCLDDKFADAWLRQGRMLAYIDPKESRADWGADFKKAYENYIHPAAACTCNAAGCCTTSPNAVGGSGGEETFRPPSCISTPDWRTRRFTRSRRLVHRYRCPRSTWRLANYKQAEGLNPNWFWPPSAKGDLYLAAAKQAETSDDSGTPQMPRRGWGELFDAIRFYEQSIALSDQFDESLRGRAEALRLLATSELEPRQPGDTLPADADLRGLFSGSGQTAVLDRSYDSARAASFVRSDRDSENLRAVGVIEVERAYLVPANVSPEYAARASATFKSAALHSQSTADRMELYNDVFKAEEQSFWMLADLAGQADVKFRSVCCQAKGMEEDVTKLWLGLDKLERWVSSLDKDHKRTRKDFRNLIAAVTNTHRMIDQINLIQPPSNANDPCASCAVTVSAPPGVKGRADGKGADGKGAGRQGRGQARARDSKGADSKGADSKGADSKGADSKGADSKGAGGKGAGGKGTGGKGAAPAPPADGTKAMFTTAYGTNPWPSEFATRSELASRIAQVTAWGKVIKDVKAQVATCLNTPNPLLDDLRKFHNDWPPK